MRLLVVSVVAGFFGHRFAFDTLGRGGDEHLELGNCTTPLDPLYGSKERFWVTSSRYLNSYPAWTFTNPRDDAVAQSSIGFQAVSVLPLAAKDCEQ